MPAGTSRAGDVVLQSSLVRRERGTVTVLLMEVNMTVMLDVREISCVGVTTASSSDISTTRRTIAVRDLNGCCHAYFFLRDISFFNT